MVNTVCDQIIMVKVKFKKTFANYKKGDIALLPNNSAHRAIDIGVAEIYKEPTYNENFRKTKEMIVGSKKRNTYRTS